jgi:hypothetical protein
MALDGFTYKQLHDRVAASHENTPPTASPARLLPVALCGAIQPPRAALGSASCQCLPCTACSLAQNAPCRDGRSSRDTGTYICNAAASEQPQVHRQQTTPIRRGCPGPVVSSRVLMRLPSGPLGRYLWWWTRGSSMAIGPVRTVASAWSDTPWRYSTTAALVLHMRPRR